MNDQKVRGINLGGWLVLERWITPSLFEGTDTKDEYSFMQEPDAAEKIKWHRRTFISENDFRWLKNAGVNAVRIPVGYWLFDGDGPFTACVSHLDWAFEMAEKYEIKVLVDLHAAPSSQNGNDHSGRVGRAAWHRRPSDIFVTAEVLKRIAKRYRNNPSFWGIELLNEPKILPLSYFVLRRFYKKAYSELAEILRPGTYVIFSDSFVPRLFSGTLKHGGNGIPVLDVHWYQFGKTNLTKYFKKLARRKQEIARLQRRQPVIIGEWSGMLSHLTLEGRAEPEKILLLKRNIEKQLDAYKDALGWFYWTYKTEDPGSIWNFRDQVENGTLSID